MDENEFGCIRVVAGIIVRSGLFLVCQRRPDASFPLKWEFPGGKVEEGEFPSVALERELKEELGIIVRSSTEIFHHSHQYTNNVRVNLNFFKIERYEGLIVNRIFNDILWVKIDSLMTLDFLDGDRPLIEMLSRSAISW